MLEQVEDITRQNHELAGQVGDLTQRVGELAEEGEKPALPRPASKAPAPRGTTLVINK